MFKHTKLNILQVTFTCIFINQNHHLFHFYMYSNFKDLKFNITTRINYIYNKYQIELSIIVKRINLKNFNCEQTFI